MKWGEEEAPKITVLPPPFEVPHAPGPGISLRNYMKGHSGKERTLPNSSEH